MIRNLLYLCTNSAFLFSAVALSTPAISHPHNDGSSSDHQHPVGPVHENGIGPDPDGDTNPATETGLISLIGNAAEAADDPPYEVITFEPPPGDHGDVIDDDYQSKGITFGVGLQRQICDGQRHDVYDSMCTYEAAPSGEFAAGYLDYLNRPLDIEFATPVCVVAMAIYPTGGKEGEPFELTIRGWTESGAKLSDARISFEWTNNTVRWRHMAGAYYLGERAKRISVSMRSRDGAEARKTLRYLIDDVAFVSENCEKALEDFDAGAT